MRNTFEQWGWCQPFWYKNAPSTKLSIWSLSWGQRQWDVMLALQVIWEMKQLQMCIFNNTTARALGYLDETALTWWHLVGVKGSHTKRCNSSWEASMALKCNSSWEFRVWSVHLTLWSHPGQVGCMTDSAAELGLLPTPHVVLSN